MNTTKISNHQIFALTTCFTSGSAILVISASAAAVAKQDAWISILLTIVFGLLGVWLIYFLWLKYPGLTYTEVVFLSFGKYVGWIICTGFVFFCFLSSTQIIWYIGNFMTISVMPETPIYIFNLLFTATIVISVLYGIEAIVRSYEIFVYFISVLFVSSIIMVSPNVKTDYILPILDNGITPVLKCSLLLSSFLISPLIPLFTVFSVHANNSGKSRKSFINGYFFGSGLVTLSILFSILILGSTITASAQFPLFQVAKDINLGTIFTRLEFIVAGVWIITLLSRGTIYFYTGAVNLSNLLKLRDHKKLVLPLGLIVFINSGIVYSDVISQSEWDIYVWPLFSSTFGLLIPLAMVIAFYIKKLLNKNENYGEKNG